MKDIILVVDDEKDLRDVLKLYLENAGYEVLEAENGLEALDILSKSDVSLMILDIMMPEMDGFELIKKLGENRDFPIIFLSARTKVQDKILGLNLGADDYIEKPFDPGEVLARVMVSLRRVKKEEIKEVVNGDLVWNIEERFIYKDGVKLDLTAKEYNLLSLFMKRSGKVFTKQEIYEFLWEEPYYNDDNTIMVHISKLREKIEDNPREPKKIKTIRGIGYILEKGK